MNFIIKFPLLFLIALVTFKLLDALFTHMHKRKYKVRLKVEPEENKNLEKKPFYHKYRSYDVYRNHVEGLLKKSRLNTSFEQFNLKRIVNAFLVSVAIIALYLYTKQSLLIVAAPLIALLIFHLPLRNLEKFSKQVDNEIEFETIDYLYHLLILLKTYSPIEAIMKSVTYAGLYMKPHLEEAVSSLIVQPNNFKPFHELAYKLKSQEMKDFANVLDQINKLDSTTTLELLERQTDVMQDLQEERFKELVVTKPLVSEKLSNYLLFTFILIIATIIATIISNTVPF